MSKAKLNENQTTKETAKGTDTQQAEFLKQVDKCLKEDKEALQMLAEL